MIAPTSHFSHEIDAKLLPVAGSAAVAGEPPRAVGKAQCTAAAWINRRSQTAGERFARSSARTGDYWVELVLLLVAAITPSVGAFASDVDNQLRAAAVAHPRSSVQVEVAARC